MTLDRMNTLCCLSVSALLLGLATRAEAGVKVAMEHLPDGAAFSFNAVPAPATNDAASTAAWSLVDGERDRNGGSLAVLHDGQLPGTEDEPAANFFLQAGTAGGRLRLDLGRAVAVQQVNSYSWHTDSRAPQVYQVFAADGTAAEFDPAPRRGLDPGTCGWHLLARVDTRPADGSGGGVHGVSIADPAAAVLGRYRYLLFDLERTEDRDAFGNTFYSEIDVIDAEGPAPVPVPQAAEKPVLRSFATADGRYHFTIDATAAPDLLEWSEQALRPVILEWYPRLVAMLPSDGFAAATNLTLRYRNDLGDTPASAGGRRINLNSAWFRAERQREARGSVVHEMVHVVQDYGRARRRDREATRTPGWLVEGIADYIRWFLYEPETKGAEITGRNLDRARYDASYRVTANFLDWVTRRHDAEIVRKLNAAAREGRYRESLWQEWTGQSLPDLGAAWRKEHEARLKSATDGASANPGPR